MTSPPIWVITKPFEKRGARLPRRREWNENKSDRCANCDRKPANRYVRSNWYCELCAPKIRLKLLGEKEETDTSSSFNHWRDGKQHPLVLGPNELRFWRQSSYSNAAFCRLCDTMAMTAVQREAHNKAQSHTSWLCKAYKYLRDAGLCPVCKQRSYHMKWGIPMHKECEPDWNQGFKQMELMTAAVERVKKEMWKA